MKIALIIILSVILIISVLLMIPTYLVFEFKKQGAEKKTELKIRYFLFTFMLNEKKEPKKEKTKKEKPQELKKKKSVSDWFSTVKLIEDDIIGILKYAKKHAFSVKKFRFLMNFGLGDAMKTGILTGSAYGTVYNVLGFLNRNIPVEDCEVKINPDFERECLDIDGECILRIKNAHIIVIAIKALKVLLKIRKSDKERK